MNNRLCKMNIDGSDMQIIIEVEDKVIIYPDTMVLIFGIVFSNVFQKLNFYQSLVVVHIVAFYYFNCAFCVLFMIERLCN